MPLIWLLPAIKSWQNNSAEFYILWWTKVKGIHKCISRSPTKRICCFLEILALVCLIFGSYDVLWRCPWKENYSLRSWTWNQPRPEQVMRSTSSEILWRLSWALSPALACPLLLPASLCSRILSPQSTSQSSLCGHNCYWPGAHFDAISWIWDKTWHQRTFGFHPHPVLFPLEFIDETE